MARKKHPQEGAGPAPEKGPRADEPREAGPGAGPAETLERILAAASRVFSQEGYAGATTRAIAAEAGVNEVTLFRRFGSKRNLLLAVVERFSALPGLGALAGQLTGDYRQDLVRIATVYTEMLSHNRRHILMTVAEAQREPELREIVAMAPARQRQMLGRYLRQQTEQGVVRDLPDPELAAQAFFGMFFEYSLSQLVLPDGEADAVPTEQVVTQLVDLFIRGTQSYHKGHEGKKQDHEE